MSPFRPLLSVLFSVALTIGPGGCGPTRHTSPRPVKHHHPVPTVVMSVPKDAWMVSIEAAQKKAADIKKWDTAVWLAAVAANDYHNWPDWPLWRAVGTCEQRDVPGAANAADGIAWGGSPIGGSPGSDYPGGLGMSRDFWRVYAPPAGVTVTNGAYASPADQIRVARVGSHNGTRMGGWSSWPGCVQAHGG